MALSSFVGSFTVPAATGNKAVTGVGFQPKAVLFWADRRSADGASGSATSNADMLAFIGAATDSTHRGAFSQGDDFTNTNCSAITTQCIRLNSVTGTAQYAADFVSMDADGFTVNFATANATAYVINFLALGGADLTNAIVLNTTSPAGTGNQATTGAGFQPTAAIFFGGITATSGGTDPGLVMGAASSTTSRWTNTWNFFGTSNSYQRTAKCFARLTAGGATVNCECDLASFDADGLTLNWSTASTGSTVFMLLLKGGQFKAGSLSQKTSTGTQATTGVGFQPTGLLLGSFCRVASASVVTTTPSMQMVGAASGTTARAATYFGDGADGVAELVRTQVYTVRSDAASPTLTAAADLSSFDADGFTLNFGTADATAREIGYFSAGSNAGAGASPNRTLLGVGV
jgi:hypothetical protein